MNGAQLIAEILKREGTEFLSCYPRNPLIEACAAIDIRTILCRQERVGVGIADGYTRIKRGKRNGVFAAQAGPGIENAFAGIAQAYAENVPMLMIPSTLPLSRHYHAADVPRRRCLPAGDQMVGARAPRAGAARSHAPRLPRHAQRQRRAGADRSAAGSLGGRVPGRARLHAACRSRAPDPIRTRSSRRCACCSQPKIRCCGPARACTTQRPSEQLAALAELIPAPVVTTNPGKSAIADSHPLSLGASTRSRSKMFTDYMAKADLVLAIGSSLTRTNVRAVRCRRARRSSTPPTRPTTSTRSTASTLALSAMRRWCSTR